MAQNPPPPAASEALPTEEDDYKRVLGGTFELPPLTDDFTQERADDAENYSDIDDDDLASDEGSPKPRELESSTAKPEDTATADTSFATNSFPPADDLFDDLFGDTDDKPGDDMPADLFGDDMDDDLFGDDKTTAPEQTSTDQPMQSIEDTQDLGLDESESEEEEEDDAAREQRLLFAAAASKYENAQQQALGNFESQMTLPPAVEIDSAEELVRQLFPEFERGRTLKFTELLAPGRARYVGKTPLKPPKPVAPTKINLDLERDHEKDFRLLAAGHKRSWDDTTNARLTRILADEATVAEEEEMDVDEDSDYENEQVGGYSWQDFQIVCEDWTIADENVSEPEEEQGGQMDLDDDFDNWEMGRASAKRRKLEPLSESILNSFPRYELPPLHDPAKATSRIASRVILDLNDPHLLVHEEQPVEKDLARAMLAARDHGDKKTQRLAARYNISNDQEYHQLTAQHQSKSRSTLGGLAVSHSMPALRLQWPYYKTKLEKQECRSFHRPHSQFPKMEIITFRQPRIVKKKHIKGQETTQIFNHTKDLSLGDNSHVLLLEYSEQHPTMMSNFGMNSRLINYYRRKDAEDGNRPKLDIGELSVLQPQDTSPLTQFGNIDPGETTPAIYNGMFKAPVFQQNSKPTDFVLVRNATGVDGSNWYLRNIEYLRVVGQQFPSTEVPGPNARKVTTAAKNRLKMVSYRLLKRSKTQTITVSKVTPHVLDPSGGPSNDMQNRQKLKEFLQFNKEHKEWELKPGDMLPDSAKIRELVKPEDVCLLEAMQVGTQQLEDAGFGSNANAAGEEMVSDDEADNEGQNLDQSLVPWQTTKNFIQAANNKAMLQLHGEGDPTRRGEAFSMLKISMKGGFKAEGESVNEKLSATQLKELGGHSYNVAKQAESYNRSVRTIWEKQKESLLSKVEPEVDVDDMEMEEEDEAVIPSEMDGLDMQTTKASEPTPRPRPARDDVSVSQQSQNSAFQQTQGNILRIVRRVRTRTGQEEEQIEIVRDPRVISQYRKLRKYKDAQGIDLSDLRNVDMSNPDAADRVKAELDRLERNKDRRLGREKQKAATGAVGSPGSPAANGAAEPKAKGKGNTGGTGRKCANCGQIGHIKTNKKLCPMLNGQMKQEDNFGEQKFTLSTAEL